MAEINTACSEFWARGEPYKQLFHHFPQIASIYHPFEKGYCAEPGLELMVANNYYAPVGAVIVYMLFCYFGQKFMKSRPAFKLENPLAVWNLGLSLFSAWGVVRTVPHLFHEMASYTFEETVCAPAHLMFGNGAAGFAMQMFVLSKFPELIDTVFIVLRKKDLIFLHWYHHVTVLLFCWTAYTTESNVGLYFGAMNYTVHACMYFYFFLQAIKMMPKWFPPIILTVMQISQMVVGTGLISVAWYYHKYGGAKYGPGECHNSMIVLVTGGIMYASYLYLFCEFAVKRFIFGVNDYEKKPKKKVN